jgi:hypothetical protein
MAQEHGTLIMAPIVAEYSSHRLTDPDSTLFAGKASATVALLTLACEVGFGLSGKVAAAVSTLRGASRFTTFLTTIDALADRLLYTPWLPQPAKAGSVAIRASMIRLADMILMAGSPGWSFMPCAGCHAGIGPRCYLENMMSITLMAPLTSDIVE